MRLYKREYMAVGAQGTRLHASYQVSQPRITKYRTLVKWIDRGLEVEHFLSSARSHHQCCCMRVILKVYELPDTLDEVLK